MKPKLVLKKKIKKKNGTTIKKNTNSNQFLGNGKSNRICKHELISFIYTFCPLAI